MIVVRFVGGKGLDSSLIKWQTYSDWSHVEFVVAGGYLGARLDGGVKIRPFNYDLKWARQEFRAITLDGATEARLMGWAHSQIGKPYDWQSIASFALHRDWRDPSAWFCSEYVAAAFDAVGHIILNVDEGVNRITPRDVGLSPLLLACPAPRGAILTSA